MSSQQILTITSRTATILFAPEGTRYHLATPISWRLMTAGQNVFSGRSEIAPVFVEGLIPDTDYTLESDLGSLKFRTKPCAGLIDAADFGVHADAQDNAHAFARAIDAVPTGGTLSVAPGWYATGPIFLKPNMTLYLPEGTGIAAVHERNNWPILSAFDDNGEVLSMWEGLPEASFAAPITAINCDGLSITGKGSIDGGGAEGDWWQWPKETRDGARRPRTLYLAHSDDVCLSGFTIQNSPSWTVHPFRCDDLNAAALNIQNPPDSPNTDGFNPEMCLNMTLTGLRFSVGDDCIAVKAGKRGPDQINHLHPTRHLLIEHCLMARGHGAVVLGSEMSGEITDVDIRACEFFGTDRGLRIKTRRGRGGCVARVRMENITMQDVATPVAINAFYFCDSDGKTDAVQSRLPARVDETTPQISDVHLNNIQADNVHLCVAAILGLPERPVTDVSISNMRASFAQTAKADIPLMALGVEPVCRGGVLSWFADVTCDEFSENSNLESSLC